MASRWASTRHLSTTLRAGSAGHAGPAHAALRVRCPKSMRVHLSQLRRWQPSERRNQSRFRARREVRRGVLSPLGLHNPAYRTLSCSVLKVRKNGLLPPMAHRHTESDGVWAHGMLVRLMQLFANLIIHDTTGSLNTSSSAGDCALATTNHVVPLIRKSSRVSPFVRASL